jgi:hypothetical protein
MMPLNSFIEQKAIVAKTFFDNIVSLRRFSTDFFKSKEFFDSATVPTGTPLLKAVDPELLKKMHQVGNAKMHH